MRRALAWLAASVLVAVVMAGCRSQKLHDSKIAADLTRYQSLATQIEYPAVQTPCDEQLANTPPPRTICDPAQIQYWDLSLEETTRLALANSKVLLDLGGTLLRAPESVPNTYNVAVQETDPQFGPEAALSAFDADFSTSLFFEKNDQRLNNTFIGFLGFFQQDYDVFQAQLSKRAVTGTQFALRHIVDFNYDNNLGNEFKSGAYDAIVEGEVRHPLLQGGGVDFNRIAGPGSRPGIYNGVLVARVRTDISLTDFEIGLRDFVSNVESAYWDLYFAYRDLDVKIKARDEALETWRSIHALNLANRRGGEADKEAQAREQYWRFEEDVQNALVGHLLEATHTNNGSTSGTFRGLPGVHVADRLRLLMGIPVTDGKLIRPGDEPSVSPVAFDWLQLSTEALVRREELRRQRWVVKNRELELIASKNFLQPNLDFVGRYRWRGFGRELLDSDRANKPRFDNAYMDLTTGDFQEWQLGAEFSMPIGFRQAHAGVRNAELRVTQARTLLREQERQVINDLSGAVAEVDRAYVVLQTNINRSVAAKDQLKALRIAYEADKAELFVVLDAQRRYAEAMDRYYQSRVEYAMAIRNVHFEKGSLLEYCDVMLAEGPWPGKAYRDAAQRQRRRGCAQRTDYLLCRPPLVSQGPAQVCPPAAVDEAPAMTGGATPAAAEPPRVPPPSPVGTTGAPPEVRSRDPSIPFRPMMPTTPGPNPANRPSPGPVDAPAPSGPSPFVPELPPDAPRGGSPEGVMPIPSVSPAHHNPSVSDGGAARTAYRSPSDREWPVTPAGYADADSANSK